MKTIKSGTKNGIKLVLPIGNFQQSNHFYGHTITIKNNSSSPDSFGHFSFGSNKEKEKKTYLARHYADYPGYRFRSVAGPEGV